MSPSSRAARRRLLPLLLACLLAAGVSGQIGSTRLTGVIRDPSGTPLPGVSVTATDVQRNVARTAVSSDAGVYSVSGLSSGVYRIDVALTGFRPLAREGVRLETGGTVRLDFELPFGVEESVTVAGEIPVLRAATASLGQIVQQEQIVGLPLNGRSFISLVSLAPSVALPQGSQLPRINGGVVNLTTKSGTNAFHGSGFEFLRHETLNARNRFSPRDRAKPRFRRSQFGGVAGGPLRQDRTFFFADDQGQRQTIGRTVISTVPTLLQRQGIFVEPIGGRVPAIFDPATTVPDAAGGAGPGRVRRRS